MQENSLDDEMSDFSDETDFTQDVEDLEIIHR